MDRGIIKIPMATGTTYAPDTWVEVQASKIKSNVVGIAVTIPHGTTVDTDTLISNDSLFRGISIIALNQIFGDSISISVVDKDGAYFPPDTVISTPIVNWNVVANSQKQADYTSAAPFKLLGGLYIRITYISTGSTDVNLGINFILLTTLI